MTSEQFHLYSSNYIDLGEFMLSFLKRNKWLMGIVLVISAILVFTFFYFKKPKVTTPIVTVTRGSITEQAEAIGSIRARHFATVKSQINGIVEAIYHDEGEYVTQNTPLIKIKPAPSPQEYAEAHKELSSTTAKEEEAKIVFERQKGLLDRGIITNHHFEYTSAKESYTLAKNSRVLAEQKLALLESGETVVGGKQIASIITVPIDGHILSREVDIGDPVISMSSAQAATELFKIADMKELMFQGAVDERDAAKIKQGMIAKIKVGSLPDKEITGKISRIALQSDSEKDDKKNNNSPFNVGFKIEITDLQFPKDVVLRSGYSATAEIKTNEVNDVLLLPMRVIQFKDEKPYVLLPAAKKKEEPKQQSVELGVSDNINVEIKTGLKLDDEVLDKPDIKDDVS